MLLQRFAVRNIAAARTRSRLASLLLLKRRPRRLNLATSPTEARVGAARAATALRWSCGVSLKQDQDQDQDQTPKASATKAAGNFLLSKATKVRLDSLRSKVTKEVAFVLNHRSARSMHSQGFFMRDIPVPMKNGAPPCAPPFGSSLAFANAGRRTATATATAIAIAIAIAIATAIATAKAQAKVDAMISVLKPRPNWRAITAPDWSRVALSLVALAQAPVPNPRASG